MSGTLLPWDAPGHSPTPSSGSLAYCCGERQKAGEDESMARYFVKLFIICECGPLSKGAATCSYTPSHDETFHPHNPCNA